jgi:hypothetical protein
MADVEVNLQSASRDRLLCSKVIPQRDVAVMISADQQGWQLKLRKLSNAIEVPHRLSRSFDVLGCGETDHGHQRLKLSRWRRPPEGSLCEVSLILDGGMAEPVERVIGNEVESSRRRGCYENKGNEPVWLIEGGLQGGCSAEAVSYDNWRREAQFIAQAEQIARVLLDGAPRGRRSRRALSAANEVEHRDAKLITVEALH